MIDATMMNFPLTTQMILRRGARLFADSVVSTFNGNRLKPMRFADVADRAAQLASALRGLGLAHGERVATLCWNSHAHLEAYLAVPAAGYALHTLNLRLFPDQIGWIARHADDRVIIVDSDLVPLLAQFAGMLPALRHIIVTDGDGSDAFIDMDVTVHTLGNLLGAHPPMTDWPDLDEQSAAAICYTSGTTGDPKGVVYSHRSIFLHSIASLGSDAFGVCNADRVLMMPPMFHGRFLQADPVARMIAKTRPTLTITVPTILTDLLQQHAREPMDLSSFRAIIAGGSAVSQHLIERVRAAWGVDVVQGWGMTETSPMCVLSHPPRGTDPGDGASWRAKSGRPVAGIEVRIVDDKGDPVAEDGAEIGRLQVRGPWVTDRYHAVALTSTGEVWFDTGDVGSVDLLGYVRITDRTKDLIKSGGEWISSVELENAIAALPGVAEAAVVAIPDPRWEERPLAIVAWAGAGMPDYSVFRATLLKCMPKFMVPDYWALLSELPKTSVGKIDKKRLRERVAAGDMDIVHESAFAAVGMLT